MLGLGKRLSKKSSLIKGSLERFTKFTKKVTRQYHGVASICMIMVIVMGNTDLEALGAPCKIQLNQFTAGLAIILVLQPAQ